MNVTSGIFISSVTGSILKLCFHFVPLGPFQVHAVGCWKLTTLHASEMSKKVILIHLGQNTYSSLFIVQLG